MLGRDLAGCHLKLGAMCTCILALGFAQTCGWLVRCNNIATHAMQRDIKTGPQALGLVCAQVCICSGVGTCMTHMHGMGRQRLSQQDCLSVGLGDDWDGSVAGRECSLTCTACVALHVALRPL